MIRTANIRLIHLIYAAVIGIGFDRLEVGVGVEQLATIFLLLVALEDFLAFELSPPIASKDGRYRAAAFGVDVLMLFAWYFALLFASIELALSFALLAAFFALKSIWEIVSMPNAPQSRGLRALRQTPVVLGVLSLIAAGMVDHDSGYLWLALLGVSWTAYTALWWRRHPRVQEADEHASDLNDGTEQGSVTSQ